MYPFLKKKIPHIIDEVNPLYFSSTSIKMLKPMFTYMKEGLDTHKKTSISAKVIDFKDQSTFPTGSHFDYCPDKVKDHIKRMNKVGKIFNFILQGHNVNIHMICSSKKENIDHFMTNAIERIFVWLYLAFHYSKPTCSQTMNIYLYMTNLEKTLPRTGEPIKEINANTAFTTSCQPSTEMHLYREEEWFKVFIHESFHNLGLDFSEFNHENTNKEILSIFPVNSDVRLFETYCEMWAEIIHSMFIAFYGNKNGEPEQLITTTQSLIDKERVFSMFQCAKILHFYGLDYVNLYERTQKSHTVRLAKYKEETHVLSYYIIKSIFMFFANDFVEWTASHNNNSINFNKDPKILNKNLMEYCGLLRKFYNKEEYKDTLELMDTWISGFQYTKGEQYIFTTLRMTINDMAT
jgi:hypothetical protein